MFSTAQESYVPIISPPIDDDIVRLREAILVIFYSISLGADAGCPSGLILAYAAYKLSLSTTASFDLMIGTFKLYKPSIKDDATNRL